MISSAQLSLLDKIYCHWRIIHENTGNLISMSESEHVYECVWGDTIIEPHIHTTSSSISSSLHESTCRCGYVFTEMHRFEPSSPRYSVCINCGYRRDEWGPGQNVIMGEDDKESTE